MNLNLGDVLLLAAFSLTLVIIAVNEWKLRRTDPKPKFAELIQQIGEKEPQVARALGKLYEANSPKNRQGHVYLEIAQAYLDSLGA